MRTGTQWYVARTNWGKELSVAAQVASLGYVGYAPQFQMNEVDVGPAFPSYVFCQFDLDDDGWQRVSSLRGAVRLLPMHTPFPSHLPLSFIPWIRSREANGDFVIRGVPGRLILKYRPGDAVQLKEGSAWGGVPLRFVQQIKDNVDLIASIFGRPTSISVPASQVQT